MVNHRPNLDHQGHRIQLSCMASNRAMAKIPIIGVKCGWAGAG
jgi:hypothetical protein